MADGNSTYFRGVFQGEDDTGKVHWQRGGSRHIPPTQSFNTLLTERLAAPATWELALRRVMAKSPELKTMSVSNLPQRESKRVRSLANKLDMVMTEEEQLLKRLAEIRERQASIEATLTRVLHATTR